LILVRQLYQIERSRQVEYVFAHQKTKMDLFIRTIGIKRAETKITLANLTFDMVRLALQETRATAA
jgi:hypothetical protein